MAFNDIERKRIERDLASFMEWHRPPPHIRPEFDLGYRIVGHSVELFETRPDWQNRKDKMENPVAKVTFVLMHSDAKSLERVLDAAGSKVA